MSLRAMTWAFGLDIKPSSRKFVLVALADNANNEDLAYPCIKTLCEKTSLDRKTVIEALQDLVNAGVLIDTEKRVGATKQVKVYRLNGIASEYNHYVYRITREDTGEYYIGVRSSYDDPVTDKYMGSGQWVKEMQTQKVELSKTILATFQSRKEAEQYESQLIMQNAEESLFRNSYGIGTVPVRTQKSPVSSVEESQKRDTEPIGTHKEPIVSNATDCFPGSKRMEDIWTKWIAHRSKLKKPVCGWNQFFKDQMEWLSRFDEETAFSIVHRSWINGYTGLFEPQNKSGKTIHSIFGISKIMEAKQKMMADLAAKHRVHVATGYQWKDEEARQKYVALKAECNQLNERLAQMEQ